MCGLVVHGLAPPTKQQCLSSATHSEVGVYQSFMPVSSVIQTGQPQGRAMKASQAMAPLGFFCSTQHLLTAATHPRPLPPTTFGMARPFLPANFLGCPPVPDSKARQFSCAGGG